MGLFCEVKVLVLDGANRAVGAKGRVAADRVVPICPAGHSVDIEDPVRELSIGDRLVADRALLPGIER